MGFNFWRGCTQYIQYIQDGTNIVKCVTLHMHLLNAQIHYDTLYVIALYSNTVYCKCSLYSVDIEAEMTKFAFYYVGIGAGVLILSYFQVQENLFTVCGHLDECTSRN